MTAYNKRLRARTIIPDELYVDRDADRQLNGVIDDMGRPGYILVARQMGKTNLLLRMKRRREEAGEIVVYIDLSIGFSDARGLFRHLIDSLTEVTSLDELRSSIEKDRVDSTLDPSVEYDRHLRRVLKATNNARVVLILDEIDSLVGQAYSDRILSQVRSMYFARANFSIYERLTYVLSGVAEPTDLIKDKNISPFNIGEKIYLADFSRAEVSTLLRKAGLQIGLDVQEAVFAWTNGNPRMTWDVYSALEDAIAASEEPTTATVDAIIQKLYLTRYDRAPLDHIRALAENDPEVRTALVALLYGKGETLDDRSKSKLYLAGITTASANDAPRLKNRVIEHALSETWLAQVEAGRKGLLTAAGRRYKNGAYGEAIELIHQFLGEGGAIESFDDIELLQYGMALYHAGQYPEAATVLERAAKQSRSAEVRSMINYHVGLSTMLLGQPAEAIDILKTLSDVDGPYKLRAHHALGTAYLKISIERYAEEIISINEAVLAGAEADADLSVTDKGEIISAAHYNLGQVYAAKEENHKAKASFENANIAASTAMKPAFASVRLRAAETDGEREAILAEVSEILSELEIPYSTLRGTLGFDRGDMAELMAVALRLDRIATFEKLLKVAQTRSGVNAFETVFELATSADWQSNVAHVRALLRHAVTEKSIVEEALLKQKLNASTIWLARAGDEDREEAFSIYWSLVSQPEALEFLSANDTVALANRVGEDLREGNTVRAKQIMSFVRRNEETLAAASSTMFAFFVFQEMVVHRMEEDYERSLQAAREILALVSPISGKNDINALRHTALVDQLRTAATREIGIREVGRPKFGRNEFVVVLDPKTGIKTRVKYKKVAERILAGELIISPIGERAPLK